MNTTELRQNIMHRVEKALAAGYYPVQGNATISGGRCLLALMAPHRLGPRTAEFRCNNERCCSQHVDLSDDFRAHAAQLLGLTMPQAGELEDGWESRPNNWSLVGGAGPLYDLGAELAAAYL